MHAWLALQSASRSVAAACGNAAAGLCALACCGRGNPADLKCSFERLKSTLPGRDKRATSDVKGSSLGRLPIVSADVWTSDHLSERPRSMDDFSGRARADHSC